MTDESYTDDQCVYCWGDPRVEDRCVPCTLSLAAEGIKVELADNVVFWPKNAITRICFQPVHAVDIEAVAGGDPGVLEDIACALAIERSPDPALTIVVRDPEGIMEGGFEIAIAFRNDYYAKVFAKKATSLFGISG